MRDAYCMQSLRSSYRADLGVGVGEAARGWIKKEFAELAALSDELSSVDTGNVSPMAHPLDGQHQRLRPDAVMETDHHEKYQANAPRVQAGLYIVPRVIE